MYKNIIFDYGQVIISFDPYYMTNVYVKDAALCRELSEIIFDRVYWDRLDNGSISDDEVKSELKKRVPDEYYDTACKVYDNWYYNNPLISGIGDLIKELKDNGVKLYLLSNISIGFAENYMKIPDVADILSLFDGLVFSGPIGMNKPNRDIFEHLLNKYNLKACDCVFIDDSEKNLAGARAVGINTIHFTGDVQKLKEELKNEG